MLNNQNFIIMNVEHFPIVTMCVLPETLSDAQNWIAEMDEVLNEKQRFVLIYPPLNKKNEKEDMDGMKAVRRWLKTGKAALTEYCAGMLMTVNPEKNDKEQLLQFSTVISAVYGAPVFVEDTLTLADKKAQVLLNI